MASLSLRRPHVRSLIVGTVIDARARLQQITNCRLLLVGRERRRIVVYAETANGRAQGDRRDGGGII